MDDLEKELEPKVRKKVIIEDPEEGVSIPWWQLWLANIINSSGTIIWVIITYLLLEKFNNNEQFSILRDAALNLVVPSVFYGILSLVAGLTLVSWLFPYFSYKRLIKNGTSIERVGCMVFWGFIALSISIIIAAGIK